MHVLPRVRELEDRHGDGLLVVGVHSGKYPAERKTERIRTACDRLRVSHPVVNDRQLRVWRSYAVEAWPTVVLVDPEGYVVGRQTGEFPLQQMDELLGRLIDDYRERGVLDEEPRDFGADLNALPGPPGPLRFPTRVLRAGDRLFISDSGHDRVLETALRREADGWAAAVVREFGTGEEGFADGGAGVAMFREPQGLALVDETLFVADRRNHAVRALDLSSAQVRTIAGTGELGGLLPREAPAASVALRSPWGLAVRGEELVVTMAGSHQLYSLQPSARGWLLSLAAGIGPEDIMDGPADEALLAQPMGASVDGRGVTAFADSESSSVRLLENGVVGSLIGTGLFDHGDRDGTGEDALLQHPQDLAWHGGALLVADTYNDKIKTIDPETRASVALPGDAGSGEALRGPSGIWADDEAVFVADTDHHRIVTIDPDTGKVDEVPIEI